MALRVGFEQGFPGFNQYWCRHTSPHEVSGAQCLSRRLILAVFELVFVFSLGGLTPSEAAGGRPQTQRSKTLGPMPMVVGFSSKQIEFSIGTRSRVLAPAHWPPVSSLDLEKRC